MSLTKAFHPFDPSDPLNPRWPFGERSHAADPAALASDWIHFSRVSADLADGTDMADQPNGVFVMLLTKAFHPFDPSHPLNPR